MANGVALPHWRYSSTHEMTDSVIEPCMEQSRSLTHCEQDTDAAVPARSPDRPTKPASMERNIFLPALTPGPGVSRPAAVQFNAIDMTAGK